jgi:hypothetical protein
LKVPEVPIKQLGREDKEQAMNAVVLHKPFFNLGVAGWYCEGCARVVPEEGCYTWKIVAPIVATLPVGRQTK